MEQISLYFLEFGRTGEDSNLIIDFDAGITFELVKNIFRGIFDDKDAYIFTVVLDIKKETGESKWYARHEETFKPIGLGQYRLIKSKKGVPESILYKNTATTDEKSCRLPLTSDKFIFLFDFEFSNTSSSTEIRSDSRPEPIEYYIAYTFYFFMNEKYDAFEHFIANNDGILMKRLSSDLTTLKTILFAMKLELFTQVWHLNSYKNTQQFVFDVVTLARKKMISLCDAMAENELRHFAVGFGTHIRISLYVGTNYKCFSDQLGFLKHINDPDKKKLIINQIFMQLADINLTLEKRVEFLSQVLKVLEENYYWPLLHSEPIKIILRMILEEKLNEIDEKSFLNPDTSSELSSIFEHFWRQRSIHSKTLNELGPFLKKWCKVGLPVDLYGIIQKHEPGERQIIFNMWNLVGEKFEIKVSFADLFERTPEKAKNFANMIHDMITYVETYGQTEELDKQRYRDYANQIEHLKHKMTSEFLEMTDCMERIEPHINHLKILQRSSTWQNFMKQSKAKKNVTTFNTCFEVMQYLGGILEEFKANLEGLYGNNNKKSHMAWKTLFPDQKIPNDDELDILKQVLNDDEASRLKDTLSYCKKLSLDIEVCCSYIYLIKQCHDLKLDIISIIGKIRQDENTKPAEIYTLITRKHRGKYPDDCSKSMKKLIDRWGEWRELLKFLLDITAADAEDLFEVVDEYDETTIQTEDVLRFGLLKRYLEQVDKNMDKLGDTKRLDLIDVIGCFTSVIEEKEYQTILTCIDSSLVSLKTIKRIYEEANNKGQSKRKNILAIMEKSEFGFFTDRSNTHMDLTRHIYDIHLIGLENEKLSLDDLYDFRDRARLILQPNTSKVAVQKEDDEVLKMLKSFIRFVGIIVEVLDILRSLDVAGYPIFNLYHLLSQKFKCENGNYNDFENFQGDLTKTLEDWNKKLTDLYLQHPQLTYFFYQQIWILEKFLYNPPDPPFTHPGYHLLKFIGMGTENLRTNGTLNEQQTPIERLNKILPIFSNQNQHSSDDSRNVKVIVVETSNKGILRAICYLFRQQKKPFGANQLFHCRSDTSWFEVQAFIYRCFYTQILHQIIRPELLSMDIQERADKVFYQLRNNNQSYSLRLGVITTVASSELRMLKSLKISGDIQEKRNETLLSDNNLKSVIGPTLSSTCTFVTAEFAGLGKTTLIKNEIKQQGKKYIKFPIYGDVSASTLTRRLRDSIASASSGLALHIDIGPVDNIEQLHEFLYCLVLFRCFRLDRSPVCLPTDTSLFIELDSSYHINPMREELVILKFLKEHTCDGINPNNFNAVNYESVKFIANYLRQIPNETTGGKDIVSNTRTEDNTHSCTSLFGKHFLGNKNLEDFITWRRLWIYINVYNYLFEGFSKWEQLESNKNLPRELQQRMMKALLGSASQFTSVSVEAVRKNQQTINSAKNNTSSSEYIIQWKKMQPFTLIFSEKHHPIFVYKKHDDIPREMKAEIIRIDDIISQSGMTLRFWEGAKALFTSSLPGRFLRSFRPNEESVFKDHDTMNHEQFFLRLTTLSNKYSSRKSICKKCYKTADYDAKECNNCKKKEPSSKGELIRPISITDRQHIQTFREDIAKSLKNEYTLTADNYIKMLLIYLRVQSRVPVLVMGETGCGKTSLIRCLCEIILDHELELFSIHAGVTSQMITDTFNEYISKARSLQNEKRQLWIFFDEFNTTSNIGFFKEIICDRTFLGQLIPENMIFLGACNPLRRKTKVDEPYEQIGLKRNYRLNTSTPLMYSVVPIPESMLEYVWDFGHLDSDTEKPYIKAMLHELEQTTSADKLWFTAVVDLVSLSQDFFRNMNDASSVSLRDVARFNLLYKWFKKEKFFEKNNGDIKHPALMALLTCYYFRLNSSQERHNYIKTIEKYIHEKEERSDSFLIRLLESEKSGLMEHMVIPSGIALNRALTDNIFVLFTCILNKIPVILCGKPGTSKTLSAKIVINSLKGKFSKSERFRGFSEMIAVSYQGSRNCTSESVTKVFDSAARYKRDNRGVNLFPVIVFDEIGLAELSPYNPLKVLHSQLEIDQCKYGFVGLSNWSLDASKMNRMLYLCSPDPELDDLEKASGEIVNSLIESLNNPLTTNPNFLNTLIINAIKALASTYWNLHERMKKENKLYYFGLRDYYALLKGIVYDSIDKPIDSEALYRTIRRQLSINFNGKIDVSSDMWNDWCLAMNLTNAEIVYKPPSFDELIIQNIQGRNRRYLMLIGKNESDFDHAQQFIVNRHSTITSHSLIGSKFPEDFSVAKTYTKEYDVRVLSNVILYAENPGILFFHDLGHLYENLYEFSNQNFSKPGRKKFCYVTLGSLYHPRCVVHDDFFCIVFVNEEQMDKYDLPFLNRFEKHPIKVDELIVDKHKNIRKQLKKWIEIGTDCFVESEENYLLSMIIDADKNNDGNDNKVLNDCEDQLIQTSSFDFPVQLSLEATANTHQTHDQWIEKYYELHEGLSFCSVIDEMKKNTKKRQCIIYTFTQTFEDFAEKIDKNVAAEIDVVRLSQFKTELELIQKISSHSSGDPSRVLVIRIDYHHEHKHLRILKHILANQRSPNEQHGICLIFHLQRHLFHKIKHQIYFHGWKTFMIDDLQEHPPLPRETLSNPSFFNLITQHQSLLSDVQWKKMIVECLNRFRYRTKDDRCSQLIEQLTSSEPDGNKFLSSEVEKCFWSLIRNSNITADLPESFQDWRKYVFEKELIKGSCPSIKSALLEAMSNFVKYYLSSLLIQLESHSLFASYLYQQNAMPESGGKFVLIWEKCWKKMIKAMDIKVINPDGMKIDAIDDLRLPCATLEYDIIREIRETIPSDLKKKVDKDTIYKKLESQSFYEELFSEIVNDENLLSNYVHDQITIIRNKQNIRHVSSSFIQDLFISKKEIPREDQLKYILFDYETIVNVMRVFDISIPYLNQNENELLAMLNRQFIDSGQSIDENYKNPTNFYQLIEEGSNFYLRSPKSLRDKSPLKIMSHPFILMSLMNLTEFLISPSIIFNPANSNKIVNDYRCITEIFKTLLQTCNYDLRGLAVMHSTLRLADSFSSIMFSLSANNNLNFDGHHTMKSTEEIQEFIRILKENLSTSSTTSEMNVTLTKLERDLVKNAFYIHEKSDYLVTYLSKADPTLWPYSGKILTILNNKLKLSSTLEKSDYTNEELSIDKILNGIDDPEEKLQLSLITRIHMFLTLDGKCCSKLNLQTDKNHLTKYLNDQFSRFKENLNILASSAKNRKLKILCSIAWIRYYLQYYVYGLKLNVTDPIMNQIDEHLYSGTSLLSTIKIYVLKHLCQIYDNKLPQLLKEFTDGRTQWIHSIESISNNNYGGSNDPQSSSMENLVDEVVQDPEHYPLLHYFSITNFHTIDFIENFYEKLKNEKDFDRIYPLTKRVLEQRDIYENLQHLLPIIEFTNYLIDKYNYRIARQDVKQKPVSQYCAVGSQFENLYSQCKEALRSLTLTQVKWNETTYKFEEKCRVYRERDQDTYLSLYLLNTSADNDSSLLLACMETLAKLQNDLVASGSSAISSSSITDQKRKIHLQSMQKGDFFTLGSDELRRHIVNNALTVNCAYGSGRDLHYDFEEIEWMLSDKISVLPLIDTESLCFFQYQYELYDSSYSLIQDVRNHISQRVFESKERDDNRKSIVGKNKEEIRDLQGCLELLLNHSSKIQSTCNETAITLWHLVEKLESLEINIDSSILTKSFSEKISLNCIVDLYQLVQECIFDEIIRPQMTTKHVPPYNSSNDSLKFVDLFINDVLNDSKLHESCKDLSEWILFLKRLLTFMKSTDTILDHDESLINYIRRMDMWRSNMRKEHIDQINLTEGLHLKHAFSLLIKLEEKQQRLRNTQALENSEPESSDNEEFF